MVTTPLFALDSFLDPIRKDPSCIHYRGSLATSILKNLATTQSVYVSWLDDGMFVISEKVTQKRVTFLVDQTTLLTNKLID